MTTTAIAPAIATCASCELDLEHCHGELVEHDDGTTSCLDGCGGPRAVHDVVVRCDDVGMGCCEHADVLDEPLPEEQPWAA